MSASAIPRKENQAKYALKYAKNVKKFPNIIDRNLKHD